MIVRTRGACIITLIVLQVQDLVGVGKDVTNARIILHGLHTHSGNSL